MDKPDHSEAKSLRDWLREETRAQHDALDGAWQGTDLENPAGYAAFLSAQLAARAPIERWACRNCPAYLCPPPTTGYLLDDLAELGRPFSMQQAKFAMPPLADPVGLAWAIGGSHLGNRALLSQMRKKGANLPARFFGDEEMAQFWRGLRPLLETPSTREQARGAIAAASAVFECFATAMQAIDGRMAA